VLEWYMGKDGAASLLALHHRETPIDNVAA